jgi:hypothetical protein
MNPNELDALIEDCLESRLTDLDATKLSALLEQSAKARARYWQAASVHGLLEHTLQSASLRVVTGQALPKSPGINRWFSWRPLTSAVAGLLFGLFSATLVWAYVAPSSGKLRPMLDESFESASAPVVTRVPLTPDVWRGDHAEVVGEQQSVKPESGQRMLRFLRAESEGKPRAVGGHIADVYHLIDVRAHRQEFSDGGAIVQASASVNATPFPEHEKFGCAISIYALDSESVPESASYIGTALETDANAMARSSRTKLDRDPVRWQRLTTEMRLPANTEFLVVRLHINQLFESDGTYVFTGSYADDVRVTLSSRPPLP